MYKSIANCLRIEPRCRQLMVNHAGRLVGVLFSGHHRPQSRNLPSFSRIVGIMHGDNFFCDSAAVTHRSFKPYQFCYGHKVVKQSILNVLGRIRQRHPPRDLCEVLPSLLNCLGAPRLEDCWRGRIREGRQSQRKTMPAVIRTIPPNAMSKQSSPTRRRFCQQQSTIAGPRSVIKVLQNNGPLVMVNRPNPSKRRMPSLSHPRRQARQSQANPVRESDIPLPARVEQTRRRPRIPENRWLIDIGRPSQAFPVTPPGIRVRTTAVRSS